MKNGGKWYQPQVKRHWIRDWDRLPGIPDRHSFNNILSAQKRIDMFLEDIENKDQFRTVDISYIKHP